MIPQGRRGRGDRVEKHLLSLEDNASDTFNFSIEQ